jgi:hypothetical protein
LEFALNHPKSIHKMVLVGTGPGAGKDGGTNIPPPNDAEAAMSGAREILAFEYMYILFFYPTETSKADDRNWRCRVQSV